MTLTPRALELSPDIRECLSMLDRIDRRHKPTDLRNAEAQVSIRCDDVFAAVLCPELLETVAQEAPRLRLAIVSEHHYSLEDFRRGTVDLEVGGRSHFPPEVIVRRVGTEFLEGIVRADHPIFRVRITAETFARFPRVVAETQLDFQKALHVALSSRNLDTGSINLITPSLYTAAASTLRSDLIATAPGVMARNLARLFGLATFKVPLDLPIIPVGVAWHARLQADDIHRWLRRKVISIVQASLRKRG